jgi:hypothetical protein
MKRNLLFILLITLIAGLSAKASTPDSAELKKQPYHKNVIKFNPTPMLLWSKKNLTFSYERILNSRQSATIMVGYLEFPALFSDNIADILFITGREKKGINVALEYRFYLKKLNARPTPSGVYLAPFASYYGYGFTNDVDMIGSLDSAGQVKGRFYVFNAGIELGYQFVLWKRVTLDFVLMGPSVSYYGGDVKISGNLNFEKLKELNEDLYNKLLDKYPMIGTYVINKDFKLDGKLDLFSVGFRYLFQIGFHF